MKIKQLIAAIKENPDDFRKKALIGLGTTALAVTAGILFNKINDDRVDIIVIEEKRHEEPPADLVYEPSED